MRRLSSLISETQIDHIDKELFEHLYIHAGFENIQKHSFYTFESIGLFTGCKELVAYIMDDLQLTEIDFHKHNSLESSLKIDTAGIVEDCFVKEIRMSFYPSKSRYLSGDYVYGFEEEAKDLEYEKSRWNGEKFNFIDIKFHVTKHDMDKNSFAEILTHELVHAWWDYILRTKSSSSLKIDYSKYDLKDEFEKLRTIIDNVKSGKYKRYDNDENKSRANKYLEKLDIIDEIVYRLNKFEIESYAAQLNGVLHNKMFDNIEDAVKEIKKTSVYQNYAFIYSAAVVNNYEYIKELCKEKTCRKLKYLANKAWKKIINHLYHICAYHLNEDALKYRTNNYLITEKIKPIWRRS